MATATTTTHSTACRAHAIGCAIENIRDAATQIESADWASAANPIEEGDSYLVDGTVGCICETRSQFHSKWILPGLDAIDAAAR